MRNQWMIFIIILLTSFTLWGCGNNSGTNSTPSVTAVPVAAAEKVNNCTNCHSLSVHVEISGIAGQNPDVVNGSGSSITHDCEDCHGGGQYHYGDGPIPYPSPDGARCATCHPQATKVMASKHNGLDATNSSMNIEVGEHYLHGYCQRCHSAEGSIAFKDVVGESTTISTSIVDYNVAVVAPAIYNALVAEDAAGNVVLHNPVCGACHNALTKELVTVDASWDPNQNGISDQYDLCTSCHNYELNDGTIFGSGENGTAEFYHNNSWYRIIPTTHYDDPTTLSGQGSEDLAAIPPVINKVEGYVIRKDSENPCFDCHGHELFTNTRYAGDPTEESTIHTQWASSGHAAGLLNEVVAAVAAVDCTGSPSLSRGKCNEQVNAAMAAYASDATGDAWTHYNWDKTYDTNPGDRSGRAACQMCHTATGAANFMSDPTNYDPTNNDYSHLDGWSASTGSSQNELLYCWGCHSNAAEGVLRTPGAITLAYTVDGVNPTLPDLGNSNVCINCHSGRGNMDKLIGAAIADPAGAAVTGGTKTHYLTAGATIFQAQTRVGYEYVGQDYADKRYFGHDSLGCAECHMDSEESHSYAVVEKDLAGVVTGINAGICVTCHDGEHALFVAQSLVGTTVDIWNGTAAVPTVVTQLMADDAAAEVEHESHGYHDALEALAAVLTVAGTTPSPGYPYFVRTDGQDVLDPPTATLAEAVTDQGHGGAMHNYSYLHHEPGAYAHNRFYAKRLIFDSIDWLDGDNRDTTVTPSIAGTDGDNLDGSITLDITNDAAAIVWLGGDSATGIVATRP